MESLRQLPDVAITSVTRETDLAPHCKVAGVIGTETRFELLLPDTWNGKFVMGGGGGFVGTVVNTALPYGALQKGYATVGNDIMRYFIYNDPDWTYVGYDLENLRRDAARVAQTLNATDADLSAFRARGGRLLMYTGWSDAAITALGTIDYYERVLEHDPSASEDVRLIMMPGVDHCFGGVGPDWINMLDEIDRWLETGDATEQLTAYWLNEQFQPDGSRLVCAYPSWPQYNGSGETRDASSFSCVRAE
jgi:hypothetical protein